MVQVDCMAELDGRCSNVRFRISNAAAPMAHQICEDYGYRRLLPRPRRGPVRLYVLAYCPHSKMCPFLLLCLGDTDIAEPVNAPTPFVAARRIELTTLGSVRHSASGLLKALQHSAFR